MNLQPSNFWSTKWPCYFVLNRVIRHYRFLLWIFISYENNGVAARATDGEWTHCFHILQLIDRPLRAFLLVNQIRRLEMSLSLLENCIVVFLAYREGVFIWLTKIANAQKVMFTLGDQAIDKRLYTWMYTFPFKLEHVSKLPGNKPVQRSGT